MTKLAFMIWPRNSHSSISVGGKVYCVGGFIKSFRTSKSITNTTEVYDIKSNSWKEGPEMGTKNHGMTLLSSKNRFIYSFERSMD
jgi:N-acetylneuraminic acid mutarotase